MTNPEWQDITGRHAVDRDGVKIGTIAQIYLDASGSPQWVTISTGLFGTKESFAPISGYRLDGDDVVLDVTTGEVQGAPNVEADGHLDDAENHHLHAYYDASFDGASHDRAGHTDASPRVESNPCADSDVCPAAGDDDTSGLTTDAR